MTKATAAGKFKAALRKWSSSDEELLDEELQSECAEQGCASIQEVRDREEVMLYGQVTSVSLAPRAGTPTLEAVLYDGSGVVTLVWLGRRQIAGIKPGASLIARGRVSCYDGRRVLYNPRYELQA